METTVNSIMEKPTKELIGEALANAYSYADYRTLVSKLAQEGKSTGPEQTDALANYTTLNDRRMKRFDKTVKVNEETTSEIKSLEKEITLLVLTESWCGDAAPSMPVMNKLAELTPNIDFKVILRDDHEELMNRFLTNGSMSIPKLIAVDRETEEVLFDWGPRPEPAAKMVRDHKEKHGQILPEIKEEIQHWYNKDKGKTTMKELVALLALE